jgi:hypothetical protein
MLFRDESGAQHCNYLTQHKQAPSYHNFQKHQFHSNSNKGIHPSPIRFILARTVAHRVWDVAKCVNPHV